MSWFTSLFKKKQPVPKPKNLLELETEAYVLIEGNPQNYPYPKWVKLEIVNDYPIIGECVIFHAGFIKKSHVIVKVKSNVVFNEEIKLASEIFICSGDTLRLEIPFKFAVNL